MSKYGYNPDEHFQTKVTLIDKDGFHKESDEVPSGGGTSDGIGLKEGLYFYKDNYREHNTIALIIFDKENSPELFGEMPIYIQTAAIYFGDAIDDADITIDPEMYNCFYNDTAIGVGFDNSYLFNGSEYIDEVILCAKRDDGTEEVENAVEGTPVHVACACLEEEGELFVKQLHSTWHIINE